MGELRPVLERLREGFAPPPDGFERLVALRSRKLRRQRMTAVTVALAVGIAGIVVAGRAFDVGSGESLVGEPGESIPQLTFIRDGELWAIGPDGIGQERLAFELPGHVNGAAWSPDGGRLAVSVEVNPGTEGGQFHLYVADADGSDPRRLTDGTSDRFPAWSLDGLRIAFARDLSDGDQELFVIDANGSGETQLTDTTGANLQPTWSPDGSRIAFTSTRDGGGNSEIYVMNADGSEPRRITERPGWDAAPDWSSEGRIAYTSDGPEPGIYAVDADDGTSELLLTDPDPVNLFVAWSPDARSLALASRRDGDPALFVLDVQTGELSRLVEGGLLWGTAWRLAPAAETPVEPEPVERASVEVRVSTIHDVADFPSAVAVGEGGIWVTACCDEAPQVVRLDPATGDIVARIPVRATPGWDFGGAGLTVAEGGVWIVGAIASDPGCCDAVVTRIDPATNSVVDEFTVPGLSDGDVWSMGPPYTCSG